MSLILRTIQSFPRGRTTEEILALVDASFDRDKRIALLAELQALQAEGRVRKLSSGRWIPNVPPVARAAAPATAVVRDDPQILRAAPFQPSTIEVATPEEVETGGRPDPQALLRYWRAALRADPRGALTEKVDRHGSAWHLICGKGPLVPEAGRETVFDLDPDGLGPDFRSALLRGEGHENALAVGWPLAVGRRSGVIAIWPVGLLAASWERRNGRLLITVSADDVMVNPEWVRGASRAYRWTTGALADIFDSPDGLDAEEFLIRLREATARGIQGKITGDWLASEIDVSREGIFDAAALFLPDESSFTAGAVRDLDRIAAWPAEVLSRTALAPLLELGGQSATIPAANVGPLNGEQLSGLHQACAAPLSVITGPPGTGKSQVIVSIAASVLMNGGSVLVASKNHQALDAVEERLGDLAPSTPFAVRTLEASGELDRSFSTVLAEMIQGETRRTAPPDRRELARLAQLSEQCRIALEALEKRSALECDLALLAERLSSEEGQAQEPPPPAPGFWRRLLQRLFGAPEVQAQRPNLEAEVAKLRAQRDALPSVDLLALSAEVETLAKGLIGPVLEARTYLTPEAREELDLAKADADFAKRSMPLALSQRVLAHRPLWLASILGTPKRIPLEPGLFDLVIFDEASQCDIASALPLFARAKRAVVVGDSRQLNFIAGLGLAQDRNLMQAQGLSLEGMGRFAQSRQSLFDFAGRVPGASRTLLRHQYRSAGPIVEYISQAFYGGALRVAYDPTRMKPPSGQRPGLAWTHVPAPAAPEAENTNGAEVRAIVSHIRELLAQGYSGTIGVTSPFRPQVQAIAQAVQAELPTDRLEAAEFRVATIDGFQGQERDLILFSPVLGATSRQSAVTFLQKDHRRLNVAISRARAVAHVMGDLHFARSGKLRTLAALAAAATEPRRMKTEGEFDSEWERRLDAAMRRRGLQPTSQYEIAGRRLDFALFGASGIRLDVEVDGRAFHQNVDGSRKVADIWRDHQLKSLGWRVRRFWVDELAKDMEACLDLIERDLA